MEALLAIVVGFMVAAAVFLMLRRSLVRFVIGFTLLSNAANVVIFTLGRLNRDNPPLIAVGETMGPESMANPLSQALILTAIVIGFGLISFTLALVYRTESEYGTTDSDSFREDPLL